MTVHLHMIQSMGILYAHRGIYLQQGAVAQYCWMSNGAINKEFHSKRNICYYY